MRVSDALRVATRQHDASASLLEKTAFRERGLSSDTSILIAFGIERALEATKDVLPAGGVRRVGLVGPGLDFTDKDEGYDVYPQQTIRPFVLIDSLIGLGFASADRLQLTTFDLNERINQHLLAARERARAGRPYTLAVPRNMDLPWNTQLVKYWEGAGRNIAERTNDLPVPSNAGNVRVRRLSVRPGIVLSIEPQDVNIVLQRLDPLSISESYDLIVATDVLVDHDIFEQSLALANVASMLRPGGIFLTNNAVLTLPGVPMSEEGSGEVSYMPIPGTGEVRDRLVWYRRER